MNKTVKGIGINVSYNMSSSRIDNPTCFVEC